MLLLPQGKQKSIKLSSKFWILHISKLLTTLQCETVEALLLMVHILLPRCINFPKNNFHVVVDKCLITKSRL